MEWHEVFYRWSVLMQGADILLNPLFTVIWTVDESAPSGLPTRFDWWEYERISNYYCQLNQGCTLNVDLKQKFAWGTGEIKTLQYLWEAREDFQTTAAILIAALLFPWTYSGRNRRYGNAAVYEIVKPAYSFWGLEPPAWNRSCSSALPESRSVSGFSSLQSPWRESGMENFHSFDDTDTVLEKISRDHWHLLHYTRPVAIRYKMWDQDSQEWKCNDHVDALLAEKAEAEKRRRMKEVMRRLSHE